MARLPEIPKWFSLGAVTIGAVVAVVFLLAREKIVVEVPRGDAAMRPAIGEATSFTVDPSWLAKPTRNEIVAYLPPGRSGKPTVGWAVALAGDSLEVRERRLYVNGAVTPKAKGVLPMEEVAKFTCPRDCIYVLVDGSKRGAQDSVELGPLPLWRILGSITP